MIKSSNTLLDTACQKIHDLEEPAYIKDSSLRIFAANSAFAQLLGFPSTNIAGIAPEDLLLDNDFTEWSEKEKRAFVFGEEETARFTDRKAQIQYRVEMERFITDDNEIFIFGRFIPEDQDRVQEQVDGLKRVADISRMPRFVQIEPAEPNTNKGLAARKDTWSPDFVAGLVLEGVNELKAGILVYDADGYLRYLNDKFYEMDEIYRGVIQTGMHIDDIVAAVHDLLVTYDDALSADVVAAARSQWIAGRLANHHLPYHEILSDMGGGRWVRVMNHCLASGVVISLRVDYSEQKALEHRLQKQMNEVSIYKSVLEALPVAAYVRDHELKLMFGNSAYEDMLGRPLDELLGKTPAEIWGVANALPSYANTTALQTGILQASEFEFERPNGQVISTYARSQRITAPDGELYVIGSITDVSNIKERERDLIEAQNRAQRLRSDLEHILDLIPAGLVVLDQNMNFELANKPFCDFARIDSRESLIGTSFFDYLYDITAKVRPNLTKQVTDATVQEWFEKTKNGTNGGIDIRLAEDQIYTYTATRFGDGRVVVTYTNITEIRKREIEISETRKALERTGALLEEASSVMEQGLLVIEDTGIIFVNKAYLDILDLSREVCEKDRSFNSAFKALVSRGEFETTADIIAGEFIKFQKAFQRREPCSSVIYLEKLRRWVKVELIPAGETRIVVVFNNITELKLRELELEKMLVRAEAADRSKSEFLANISHEIRTPMNGVLAMAGLLTSTELDTRQKTFLDVVTKSGKTLLTIINDVLDFSKMDGGKLELKHVVFSPSEAVEDVAMLLSSRASERKLDFVVEIASDVPGLVRSDAGRFRQIVTNLLSNAMKFTDVGHVIVRLSAEYGAGKSCDLKVTIEDTGIGMADEKIANIENALNAGQKGGDLYPEGGGLGLPITVGLIRLFAGTLAFRKQPGHGTVVDVSLPVAVESARSRVLVTPSNISRSRVLIIDDHGLSRTHMLDMVTGWGFDVAGASSARQGLSVLSAAHLAGMDVDAVLIDYTMNDLTGVEIARAIRADAAINNVDILFAADLDHVADDGLLNALNIRALVAKPVRRGLLHESLVSVLQSRVKDRTNVNVDTMRETPKRARPLPHSIEDGLEGKPIVEPVLSTIGPVSVLVAEDNEINKIVFTQILQAIDVSFCIVDNGQDAVEAWQKLTPDVILMDVDMPVMNGFEATKRIRALEIGMNRSVPIIGVTAHADEQAFQACLECGMDDYVSKPLSPERLGAKLLKWKTKTGFRQLASK